jgi:photosystem II stability/assembly factor-like uncharacterized protein
MPRQLLFSSALVFFALLACSSPPAEDDAPAYQEWPVSCSVRALEVAGDGSIWYAGSDGCVGQFRQGQWDTTTVSTSTALAFRSLAAGPVGAPVYALGISSPALLYRLQPATGVGSESDGIAVELVHRVDDSTAFFDAMLCLGAGRFIAMGDPIESCLAVLRSMDDGGSWQAVPCENIPTALPGEAAFAASNTNLVSAGDTVWMVSGGGASRVFRSLDAGLHWSVIGTPLLQGGEMTGAFTMAFADARLGIIWGGDWQEKGRTTGRAAITRNGGDTWELLAEGHGPGYLSCVQYRPGTGGSEWVGVGTPTGLWHTADQGASWTSLSDSSYYTCRFTEDGRTLWLAGHEKVARLQLR